MSVSDISTSLLFGQGAALGASNATFDTEPALADDSWSQAPAVDINLVPTSVLREAAAEVVEKKRRDATGGGTADHGQRTTDQLRGGEQRPAVATAKAPEVRTKASAAPAAAPRRATDLEAMRALGIAVETAIERLHLDAEEARRQMASGDPDSDLARDIAEQTKKDSKQVADELQKMAEAVAQQPEELGWICRHCGSTNPGCPYKDLPPDEKAKHNALKQG